MTKEEIAEIRKAKARERSRLWRLNNLERDREKSRAYAEANRDAARRRAREWYENNKERALAASRAYAKTKHAKDRSRLYREKNKERVSAGKRNYKVRKRGAIGTHTGQDVKTLYSLQRGKCANCAHDLRASYHVDHIVPLSLGGSNDKHNIQLLCPHCNLRKWAKHPIQFARQQGRLL